MEYPFKDLYDSSDSISHKLLSRGSNAGLADEHAIERERRAYLNDPLVTEKIVSHFQHQMLPEDKASKIAPGSVLDKIEKGMPSDDPRKGLGYKVLAESQQAILDNPSKHPIEVVSDLYKKNLTDTINTKDLYGYIFNKEASLTGGRVATVPGYDKYKQERMNKNAAENTISPLKSFAEGAAFDLALTGLGMFLGSVLPGAGTTAGGMVGKVAAPIARNFITKAIINMGNRPVTEILKEAALTGVGFAGTNAVMYPIKTSQWGEANPISATLLEFGAYGGVAAGARKAFNLASTAIEKPVIAATEELTKDASLTNILTFDEVTKKADTLKTAMPRVEFWKDADSVAIGKLQAEGKSFEEATSIVSSDVMKRQLETDALIKTAQADEYGENFKNRVNLFAKLHPEDDLATRIAKASSLEGPGVLETAFNTLRKSGMKEDDILALSREDIFNTAYHVSMTNPAVVNTVKAIKKPIEDNAVKLLIDPTMRLQYDKLIDEWAIGGKEALSKLSAVDVIERLGTAKKLNDNGMLTDDLYHNIRRQYEGLVSSDITDIHFLSRLGEDLMSTKWMNTATIHLDAAIQSGNFNRWNDIITHFIDNVDSKRFPKASKEFYNKIKIFDGDPKLIEMAEKEGMDITKTFNRMLYGNTKEELLPYALADSKILPRDEFISKYTSNWSKYIGVAAMTGLGVMSVGELLGPTKAEAAGLDSTIKIIPKLLRATLDQGGAKTIESGIQAMLDNGYAYPKISNDGFGLDRVQRFFGMVPDLADVKSTKSLNLLQRIMTPGGQGQMLFKDWASPSPQLAYATTMAHNNSDVMLNATRNILKMVPGYKRVTDEVTKAFDPFVAKYGTKMAEASYLDNVIESIDSAFTGKYAGGNKLLERVSGKFNKGRLDDIEIEQLDGLKSTQAKYIELRKGYDDVVANYSSEWTIIAKGLAEKNASTRIALALEGVGMKEGDAWLVPLMTKEELWAVGKIKSINDQVKTMMIAAGEKPIIAEQYIHHAGHPNLNYKAAMEGINKFTPDIFTGIDMASFHHRAGWSKQLMPDIEYVMEKYLPDANMRVAVSEFWKTWKPFWKQADLLGYRGISSYFENISKGFRNVDEYGTINAWANRITLFEVARLIAFQPSVALKHGFKVLANVANYGFGNALENIPRDMSAWVRNTRMDMGGAPKDALDYVMRGHINTQRIYAMANDMAMYGVPKTVMDKYLEKISDYGAFMMNASERWDRGTSFMNAMTMATKQGMTPEQSSYLVMDAVLKNNFLSGVHNPTWLRDPKTRLLFLFQGTPFKLAEQRALIAINGGGAFADAGKETYRQLQNLKKDIIEGSNTFKMHMIKDALMSRRDLAGNSYAAQLVRNILVIGATVEGGKYFLDGNMWGMFHVPFVKTYEQSMGVSMFPALNAAYQAKQNKDEDAFFVTDFLKKWLTSSGGDKVYFGPAASVKLARITDNDIPAIYKDSKLRYLFAIPTYKDEE